MYQPLFAILKHPLMCVLLMLYASRTRVKARHYSRKLSAQGTFCGAEVRRGVDWQWGDQDGKAILNNMTIAYNIM
jgi:hypothetical protein